MEVRVNKDIQEYKESMFFGLTLRQFFFSALGCAAAVGIYFLCRDALGLEITTWLCVLGVIPFAAAGFLRYNGMHAEKFIAAYVKSRFVFPSEYISRPKPIYYEMMEENIALRQGSLSKRELRKIKRRQEKVEKKAGEEKKESKKRKRGGR